MELQPPETYKLSDSESKRIFSSSIEPFLFKDIVKAERPKALFVAGQPGAGKTVLLGHIKREMDLDQPHASALVTGDMLRAFHPMYETLLNLDDTHAAYYTDHDSGKWAEKGLERAAQLECNVLVEGTLRRPDVTVDTATKFKDAGYSTELNLLVVPEVLSRLGILQRYFEQVRDTGVGRFTVTESHDASYSAIPESLRRVIAADVIDEINFYHRGGVKIRSFRPSVAVADEASNLYTQLRDVPLSARESDEVRSNIDIMESLAHEFHKEEVLSHIEDVRGMLNE